MRALKAAVGFLAGVGYGLLMAAFLIITLPFIMAKDSWKLKQWPPTPKELFDGLF